MNSFVIHFIKFGCQEEKFRDADSKSVEAANIQELVNAIVNEMRLAPHDWDKVEVVEIKKIVVAKTEL